MIYKVKSPLDNAIILLNNPINNEIIERKIK